MQRNVLLRLGGSLPDSLSPKSPKPPLLIEKLDNKVWELVSQYLPSSSLFNLFLMKQNFSFLILELLDERKRSHYFHIFEEAIYMAFPQQNSSNAHESVDLNEIQIDLSTIIPKKDEGMLSQAKELFQKHIDTASKLKDYLLMATEALEMMKLLNLYFEKVIAPTFRKKISMCDKKAATFEHFGVTIGRQLMAAADKLCEQPGENIFLVAKTCLGAAQMLRLHIDKEVKAVKLYLKAKDLFEQLHQDEKEKEARFKEINSNKKAEVAQFCSKTNEFLKKLNQDENGGEKNTYSNLITLSQQMSNACSKVITFAEKAEEARLEATAFAEKAENAYLEAIAFAREWYTSLKEQLDKKKRASEGNPVSPTHNDMLRDIVKELLTVPKDRRSSKCNALLSELLANVKLLNNHIQAPFAE